MGRFGTHAGPYALGTFRAGRREFAGLVVGRKVLPIDDAVGLRRPSVRELVEHWDAAAPELAERAGGPADGAHDLAALDVLPPVEPRQIFQSGANYPTDDELRAELGRGHDGWTGTGDPYVFTGAVSAMCGAYDDVILPAGTVQNDVEPELAAVIGRPARRVSRDDALRHVVGYTIVNDITTREWVRRCDRTQPGTDWFRAKNSPTFLPTGPFLVPAAFVGDPMDLQVSLTLNGRTMQDESTKNMIFDVAAIVSYCSQIATLLPGDLVLTGSPGSGTARGRALRAGDVMEATITGLGVQRNGCVDEAYAS